MKKLLENSVQNRLWRQWFAIGIIVLATTVVYYKSLNSPFILDDIPKIVENPDIKNLSNLKTKLVYPYNKEYDNFNRNDPSRPLIYLTFTLNYHFGKLNTFGYHLVNLLFHIFTSILIFILTGKIITLLSLRENEITKQSVTKYHSDRSGESRFSGQRQGIFNDSLIFPLFVALFFAIHPISASTVTYIFKRSDILATFFYILSLLFFTKTLEKNTKLYIFSLLCFVLSLASKPIAVTLPAIILIFDYIFLSNFKIGKVIEKKYYHIPFWIMLFIYLLFRYFYLGSIGDVEAVSTWNRYSYLIIQPYVTLKYLKLLFIPTGLCFYHAIEPPKTIFEFKILISFLFIIGILMLVYRYYRKKTDISKIFLFCISWFFITLSPTSSFFSTTIAMDDTRMYLSGFGFYLMIVFIYFLIFKIPLKKNLHLTRNWILLGLMGIHITLLGVSTCKRNKLYKDPVLLWQDVISKYPKSPEAHNNLGNLFYHSKRFEEAEKEYREAIRINPNLTETHNNLGNLFYHSKRFEEAEKEYRVAIRINPNNAAAHSNLGALLYHSKRFEEAEKEYRVAIRIDPNYADAYFNLGILLHALKRFEEAEKEYRVAIRIGPNYADTHNKLGVLLKDVKRFEEAEKEYREAIRIDPNYAKAHYNLGNLYLEQKNYDKALREFEIIIKLLPNNQITQNKIKLLQRLIMEKIP